MELFVSKDLEADKNQKVSSVAHFNMVSEKTNYSKKANDFFEKASKKFNNKFKYDKSSYIKMTDNIRFTCPKHGEMEIKAISHLRSKYGCDKCTSEYISENSGFKLFLKKAKAKYGDKFTYIEESFKKMKGDISFICPKHGEVKTKVTYHLDTKSGCPSCNKQNKSVRKCREARLSTFLDKANARFNNKFTYIEESFINANSKIKFICPEHGEQSSRVSNHLESKFGCYDCFMDLNIKKEKNKNLKERYDNFLSKVNKKFKNKFTYIESSFVNDKSKISYICPEHGEQSMLVVSHLRSKTGCVECVDKTKKINYFIGLANKRFNNKFKYIKSSYVKMSDSIRYICPEHGEVSMMAKHHLNSKTGCVKCTEDIIQKENTEIFFNKAKERFGNKFKYDESTYINNKSMIKFICPEHGKVEMMAIYHISSKYGCNDCSRDSYCNANNAKNFFRKASEKFNNKFQYDVDSYKNSFENVKFICPNHGEMEVIAKNHLESKYGCNKCNDDERNNNKFNSFLKSATKKYGNKFKYSKSDFVNNKVKTKIICPTHGEFYNSPANHLATTFGCPECAKDNDRDIFFKKANEQFNNKFQYDESSYKKIKGNISFICPSHGKIKMNALSHLKSKYGCVKCSNESQLDTRFNLFVSIANEKYGEKYKYSKSDFIKYKNKIKIVCPDHGSFFSTPDNHLVTAFGCPNCAKVSTESVGELKVKNFLNELNIGFVQEKSFKNLKGVGGRSLRFDFFIKDLNLIIEYDGKQHYEPVDVFGGEEYYATLVKNDNIKNKFCKDNGIGLVRIRYDEDVAEKLAFLTNLTSSPP